LRAGHPRAEQIDDDRVRFPNRFANNFFGQSPGRALGVEEPAGGVDRAVGLDPVRPADIEILLTVTGAVWTAPVPVRGSRARPDAQRRAFEERVLVHRSVELQSLKRSQFLGDSHLHSAAVAAKRSSATM
jgi:hypothetical protein